MSDLEDFDLPSQKQAKDAFKGGGGEQVVSSSEEEQTRLEDQKPGVTNDEEKKSLFQLFRYNAREISKSPRDLLVVYIAVFLDALSYYMFSYALIMHLGLEVGLTDANSGLFYGLFGVCITLATLVLGFVMDKIGIRLSVCISSITALATRMGMAYAVLARSWLLTAIILFLGVGPSMALMGPALPVAIKRQVHLCHFFDVC
jgi:predicted MFS family arabinose efflux permease